MAYVPFTYQERPVSSAKLNANFAGKADLDSVTGKVRADQLPDTAAIAHAALDASIAAALAAAQAAQGTANTAVSAAATAEADAQSAHALAATAKAEADAAIPLAQKGAASGVAPLTAGSKIPIIHMPYSAGTNVSIDGSGVISATGSGSSGPVYTPPMAADFPIWVNKGTSTITDGAGTLVFEPELVGASSGNVLKGAFKSLPSGDFDIMVIVDKGGVDWPFFAAGVSLLESSTGHYHSHHLGSCFYADPAYSALSGDHSGMAELFWTDANTVSLGIGLPCPGSRLYSRITRVSGVVTRYFKRSSSAPWIGLWGVSLPSFNPDKIGISCLGTCYGGYTNWPTQTFHVPHFGAVV